jgi:hypothetical protein
LSRNILLFEPIAKVPVRHTVEKDGIQYFQDILGPGFMSMKLRFRRGDLNKLVLQLAPL